MSYEIGDSVRYTTGFRGYFNAEVVGYDGGRLIIEFSSGLQLSCWPDELEAA